ncbi:MAG: MYXO-CTERM sorting domain-containing protein [Deltaproteobacteria bacterium]|nr:MYXO-CTERM sorting domain-containing protein [Deltaproteobacteria bacterium]
MKHFTLYAGLCALSLLATSAPASAQALQQCQGIALTADSTCEVQVAGGCTAQCEPVRFRAACSGELWASCQGDCTGSVTASCTASCDVTACEARCDVDPGSFNCQADCDLQASASCDAQCSDTTGDAQAECTASCRSTFSAECSASCQATPPSANCSARCQASCEGSCQAESTLSCQVDCQAGGYADCYTSLEGGCTSRCEEPTGALFCDGQYVDVRDSVQACIDELSAQLDLAVDVSATGSAGCDGGTCVAEGTVSVGGCSVSSGADAGGESAWLALFAVGLVAIRRRR